jgi:hypothetical protein
MKYNRLRVSRVISWRYQQHIYGPSLQHAWRVQPCTVHVGGCCQLFTVDQIWKVCKKCNVYISNSIITYILTSENQVDKILKWFSEKVIKSGRVILYYMAWSYHTAMREPCNEIFTMTPCPLTSGDRRVSNAFTCNGSSWLECIRRAYMHLNNHIARENVRYTDTPVNKGSAVIEPLTVCAFRCSSSKVFI